MSGTQIKIKGSVLISPDLPLKYIDEHAEDAMTQFYDRFEEIVNNHKERLRWEKQVKDARFMQYLNTPCSQYSVVPG